MKKLALILLALAAAALPALAENAAPKRSLADGFGKFRIGVPFNVREEKALPETRFRFADFDAGENFPCITTRIMQDVAGCEIVRVYFDRERRPVAIALDLGRLREPRFRAKWKKIAALYNLAPREGVPDAFDEIDPATGKPTGFALHVSRTLKTASSPAKRESFVSPVYGGDGKRFRATAWRVEEKEIPERTESWTEYAVTLVDERTFRDAYERAAEEEWEGYSALVED